MATGLSSDGQQFHQNQQINKHLSPQPTTKHTTKYSNHAHCEVYSIQLYVLKFVSDLLQIGVFLQVLRFSPPIYLTATI